MFLLDTHTFYWFITDDERLPVATRERIETEADVYVSIVSFWEMAIKESIGKLRLPVPIDKLIDDCDEMRFKVLPNNGHHLSKLKSLPFILHSDSPRFKMLSTVAV